jgi:hypothetical protein
VVKNGDLETLCQTCGTGTPEACFTGASGEQLSLVRIPLPRSGTLCYREKFTVTFWLSDIVTIQVLLCPAHLPPQLENLHPVSGFGVSLTSVPAT